jgi:Sulfotransferase family
MRSQRPQPRTRVLFLAGMGRSGSTLISRLLGQVEGVQEVGELCYIWDQGVLNNRLCSCGQPFHDCRFWTEVGSSAFGGWHQVDAAAALRLRRAVDRTRHVPALAAGRGGRGFRRYLQDYTKLMATVYAAIGAVTGRAAVVDSSKYPSSAYVARRTPGIELRVVHLVRESHGVCHSWGKLVSRPDRDGRPMARFSPSRTALEWDVYNVMVEALQVLGVPRVLVRYEDFVADPAAALRRILGFAGIDAVDQLDAFLTPGGVVLHRSHSLTGNPMRFRLGPEPLTVDDAWRRQMPDSTRRLVTGLTIPGLVRYRYLPGGQW